MPFFFRRPVLCPTRIAGLGLSVALLGVLAPHLGFAQSVNPVVSSETVQQSVGLNRPSEPAPSAETGNSGTAAALPPAAISAPISSPVANAIALIAAPPTLPDTAHFRATDWPDDAGRDGLVVPAQWLWARIGHTWTPAERAQRLSDPVLWRQAHTTPQGWVQPGDTVAGWLPSGPGACAAAQRIAFALRAHKIPLTLDEHDAWAHQERQACPRTLAELRAAQSAPALAPQPFRSLAPSTPSVAVPQSYAQAQGLLPQMRAQAQARLADPRQPAAAQKVREFLMQAPLTPRLRPEPPRG